MNVNFFTLLKNCKILIWYTKDEFTLSNYMINGSEFDAKNISDLIPFDFELPKGTGSAQFSIRFATFVSDQFGEAVDWDGKEDIYEFLGRIRP